MPIFALSAITLKPPPGFGKINRLPLLKVAAALTLACVLSACVYVPVVNEHEATASNCKTLTQSMSLDSIDMHANVAYGCHEGECLAGLLAAGAVVSAGSVIISGSIVLTGNTLHWLEYQGTCSDGYLNRTKQLFLDSIDKLKPTPTSKPTPAPASSGVTNLPGSPRS
jgi:hypothetical protein